MSILSLHAQIRSLQAQLSVLRAQVVAGGESEKRPRRFGELYGILAGRSDSSEDDIGAAEYSVEWDNVAEPRPER